MSSELTVTILCQLFYPEMVSTGQTMTELACSLVKKGVRVDVISGPPTVVRNCSASSYMAYEGISIHRVYSTRFSKLSVLGKLCNHVSFALSCFVRLLKDTRKTPLLVLTNPPFLLWIAYVISKIKKRPFIYLLFDLYPETAVADGLISQKGVVRRVWSYFNQKGIDSASKVICIGRCMRDIVLLNYQMLDLDRLVHVPVWCDDVLIQKGAKKHALISEFGLEGKCIVGYSGNMARFHDMKTIMDAVFKLKEHPEIVFLFVGEGYQKAWCVDYVATHEISNCFFSTYVEKEALGSLLGSFDMGLVSLMSSQTGLSVPSKSYGLMAAGIPLIAVMNDVAEVSLMIKECGCGFSVLPGDEDGLVRVLEDTYRDFELKKDMGLKGIKAIHTKYKLDLISDQYIDLIRAVF